MPAAKRLSHGTTLEKNTPKGTLFTDISLLFFYLFG
jgi:hypothetical protein